ncbi:MAG: 16S rRNA processing protein RimM, partial [Peptococcaceae bacterium]|nr:16S rRNA processing protein RimM [Peptococcaceae bacterium]
MENELMISVAKIVGVQGLNGELKLVPLSDHPGRFTEMAGKRFVWQRDGETRLVEVESVRGAGRPYLLILVGVNSRNLAEAFVGGDLAVPESELLPLPEGSFYIFQLVGLSVLDERGHSLGQIKEVLQPG